MRVLVLTYFYAPEVGAPALRMQAITKAFVRRGWSVDIITGMPQYPLGHTFPNYRRRLWHQESFFGARVYRVLTYSTQGLGIYRLASYLSHDIGMAALGTLLRRSWDVIFVESPPLLVGLPGLWLSALTGARLALDITDLWPDSARELKLIANPSVLRWGEKLEQALYRRAWRITCATRGIARRLRDEKGVPGEKIDVLLNGVDPQVFSPGLPQQQWTEKLGLNGRRIFTYAGVHSHAQGLRVILDTARLLQGERDIAFLLIGDGPTKSELVAIVKKERLDNVRFLPAMPVEEAARVLAVSYGSIVPLRNVPLMRDAVPSKMITALSAGAPVIFSGEGEAAELLRTHACGLVVEPENPGELARAIRWLNTHPDERDVLVRNGLNLVRQKYQWDKITDRWLERWIPVSLSAQLH
ncbi:MAG: glycosyltransferase family 4 protein [Candidatus Methylomirabilis oxyfera]|nr:glycosyltransferase family 4 protein [Candidatus Methylomirabilis oxyfera]